MFGCEEEEFYDPNDSSSPPSPADEEIVVNKSVNLPESSAEVEEKKQYNPKVVNFYPSGSKTTEGPWLESDFRNAQVMDKNERQILYEKLQKYAESWSVSEPESESSERFYDVDSGSDSVEELDLNDQRNDTETKQNGQDDATNLNISSDLARENTLSSLQEYKERSPSDCSLVSMRNQQILGTNINSNSVVDSGITSPIGTFDGDIAIHNLSNNNKKQEIVIHDLTSKTKKTELPNTSVNSYSSLQNINGHGEDCEHSLAHGTKESVFTKEETRKSLYSTVDESVQTSDPDSLHRRLEGSSKSGEQYNASDNKDENKHIELNWNVLNRNKEEDEGSGKKLVRSTSLKSGKTPPGTPSRKKIVRFADALGLDLEAVRHIGSEDDEPNIPASAFKDLKVTPHEPNRSSTSLFSRFSISGPFASSLGVHAPSHSTLTLIPLFLQPVTQNSFLDRVRNKNICLENIIVSDLNVQCHVRVHNISFEKLVLARYTTNEWLSYEDVLANYVHGSCDGFSDKFSLNFFVPHMSDGQRLIFAIRLVANGQEFWDNNDGKNYVLRCHSHSSGVFAPPTEESSSWMHHFM
ncbi:glycogen-binding subunit 76A-like [Limulus polyphemus]|uniref:Glycogen-binding subunit 76A-like n=1 Tax=Limulus polyphemus TaxID=6850 RepID=A0ABM1S6C3_LIMPO|nr:glycogen-binding subunit 76A-like [Limulus polyphemus]